MLNQVCYNDDDDNDDDDNDVIANILKMYRMTLTLLFCMSYRVSQKILAFGK